MWGYCCIFMSDKLIMLKRVRHGHRSDSSEFDTSEEDFDHIPRTMEISGSSSRRTRDYRRVHLRKSLRPRSHRIRVGLGSDFDYGSGRIPNAKHGKHFSTIHSIRVTHTSQFVRKRASFRGRAYPRQRRWTSDIKNSRYGDMIEYTCVGRSFWVLLHRMVFISWNSSVIRRFWMRVVVNSHFYNLDTVYIKGQPLNTYFSWTFN
jgi:hypothetical protein